MGEFSRCSRANRRIAGTGKTYLSCAVVDHVRERIAESPTSERLAFSYCGKLGLEERQTSSPLLLSLMRQLLPVNDGRAIKIIKKLGKLWEDADSNSPELAKDMIAEWLLEIASFYPATTIILDGLDSLATQARLEVTEILGSVLEASQMPLRLFLSSRDNRQILRLAESSVSSYQVTLRHWHWHDNQGSQPHTFFDIERVVTQELREIPPDVRDRIVRASEGS